MSREIPAIALGRADQNRDSQEHGVGIPQAQEFSAVHDRHPEVEENGTRSIIFAVEPVDGLPTILREVCSDALFCEGFPEQFAKVLIVVDDEDRPAYGGHSPNLVTKGGWTV